MPIGRSCIVCGARTEGTTRCAAHENRGHVLPRSCIGCGERVEGHGNYCPACEVEFERSRNASARRDHYRGDYQTRAKRLRARAYAGLEVCWCCGGGTRPRDPWHVDHVDAGDPGSELRVAHRSCNIARANRARARR